MMNKLTEHLNTGNQSTIEDEIAKLSPELLADHDKCLSEGLKDEYCSSCGVVFLAHHHFLQCGKPNCPMSNGKTFFEMMKEYIDTGDIKPKE